VSVRFDYAAATTFLLAQAGRAASDDFDLNWFERIQKLSELCESAGVRTHIAFLGTALLAKALNPAIDPHTVKPTHAPDPSRAYPARSLAEQVLVPVSHRVGMHLGVTGREPLNNQPYFRMRWLGDETPISVASRPPFDYMLALVADLEGLSGDEAAAALRAFIKVRTAFAVSYERFDGDILVSLEEFPQTVDTFVQSNSENGKRAQAVAAGLIDLTEGPERVVSGRVNDPSRKHPGDVCVLSADDPSVFLKAIEVRDKPVSMSDAYVFAGTCQRHGVYDVAFLMVSNRQQKLDDGALTLWAAERGIAFRLFYGWKDIITETLFWSDLAMRPGVSAAVQLIEDRLREVEISAEGYEYWQSLFRNRD